MAPRRAPWFPFRRAKTEHEGPVEVKDDNGTVDSDREPTEEERNRALADYVLRFQPHCERYLSRIAKPQGKSVLVIGAGSGTEMLWAMREGATEVVGIDVSAKPTEPLALALADLAITQPPPFEIVELGVDDVAQLDRHFDLVLSNNTFEHLPDIRNAFRALRSVVDPVDGRLAVFTDPLYYSSHGAHLAIEPWAHLHSSDDELRSGADADYKWHAYKTLNEMTLISFLEAIREADYVIRELFVVADRELDRLGELLPQIGDRAPVTDLALEGIGVTLSPPPQPPASENR